MRFQHKMSLERVASWRIDNQRARSRETQSGSDPGLSTSQPNHPIRGRKPIAGLPLDRTGAVPPAVPPTKPWGARTDPALSGQDDGPESEVTRLIARYRRHGTVQPGVYRRHRFPQRYTRADLELQVSNGYVGKFLKAGLNFDWSGREDLNLRPPGPEL